MIDLEKVATMIDDEIVATLTGAADCGDQSLRNHAYGKAVGLSMALQILRKAQSS